MKVPIRTVCTAITLSALSFSFFGCVSVSSSPTKQTPADSSNGRDTLMADLTPRNGNAVFMGVAGRLRDRDSELEEAVLHVAEQASRYVRFFAEYQYITETTTDGIGYLDDIDGRWDEAFADGLVEKVEVIRKIQDNEGTYVLAVVEGIPAPPSVSLVEDTTGGAPSWVNSPPGVPEHISVVGITTPSRRFRDSVDRADQEALKEILLNTGTTVRMMEDLQDRDRQGTLVTTTSVQEASATLRSFYILARYVSPDRRYYYSLAIAREE